MTPDEEVVQAVVGEVVLSLSDDTFVVRRVRPGESEGEATERLVADLHNYLARLMAGTRGQLATEPDLGPPAEPCEALCWCGRPCSSERLPRHGEFHGCTAVHAEAWIERAKYGGAHHHPEPFKPEDRPCTKAGCLGYQPRGIL